MIFVVAIFVIMIASLICGFGLGWSVRKWNENRKRKKLIEIKRKGREDRNG